MEGRLGTAIDHVLPRAAATASYVKVYTLTLARGIPWTRQPRRVEQAQRRRGLKTALTLCAPGTRPSTGMVLRMRNGSTSGGAGTAVEHAQRRPTTAHGGGGGLSADRQG